MRLDYDRVADAYDAQPFRAKEPDPDARGRRVLDIACGTGNQLIANRAVAPRLQAGVDRFHGMLRRARAKCAEIPWVQADAARLPFADASFDYATMQFAFHHVGRKERCLADVRRVLAPGGRFVLSNLCPQRMRGWLVYRYFPEALARDLEDFMPPEETAAAMQRAGFAHADVAYDERRPEEDLAAFAAYVRVRANISQLTAIDDAAYAAGLARIPPSGRATSELCLVTITARA